MFALIRHAGYRIATGSLTPEGHGQALALAEVIKGVPGAWTEVRTSPTARTRETASIIAEQLSIPVIEDARLGVDGDLSDLMPPTEPKGIIFVSHLPILSRMLRAWSRLLGQNEPPLTEIACGYLISPEEQKMSPLQG
ncbi:histidine phosphatase family protein [Candidatus Uhrbacteria bacterium]|nr:histidine phosphatase family protein [Candidatus Uhrbacteria bacterium]